MKQPFLHRILNAIMRSRAQKLTRLLTPFLMESNRVLDVGSGTGHNAIAIREHFATLSQKNSQIEILQIDVVDISTVGESPMIFDGVGLKFGDNKFDSALMIYMLQYPQDPISLLKETARVCDSIIVIQSTYEHRFAKMILYVREFFWGRLAFYVSRLIGYVKPVSCSLDPARFLSHAQLQEFFEACELHTIHHVARPWWKLGLNRDIYVLQKRNFEP